MGMFDTFYGSINCIECKEEFIFEEQTKNYDCRLNEFLLGDYIDKKNESYFYLFSTICPHCKKTQRWAIAIKEGQIIGYYPEDKVNIEVLNSSDNIEEGYFRNIQYKKMCEEMLGTDKNKSIIKKYNFGETIIALETQWVIDDIYKEVLKKSENEKLNRFYELSFKDNYILKVHNLNDSSIRRLIILRDKHNLKVVSTNFYQKEKWNKDDYNNRYIAQMGTEIIKYKEEYYE